MIEAMGTEGRYIDSKTKRTVYFGYIQYVHTPVHRYKISIEQKLYKIKCRSVDSV